LGMTVKYDHITVEKKWQDRWEAEKLYVADIATGDNPFFNLWMFPYPSAEGLHAGHAFASTGSDIYGRFMRMNKKDVFQPIGYDSFGIHSENYAIKINEKPGEVVSRTTKNYEKQMRSLGHGYDWTRTVTTSEVDYYRWTQWLFIKMFEAGLAYRKKATVNFCPSCKTVLADEQVIDARLPAPGSAATGGQGKCERCSTVVGKKDLDQWFFKITDYAERLLTGLDKIDWSKRVITAQRNWIGKSQGMLINFKKENGEDLPVFTTRPDTLNAVTFVATSKLYQEGSKEKLGKFTGEYAINPLDGREIPIWDTNYVAPNYGTGVIMGVPAHDQRDMEFAKKYHIDILEKEPVVNNIGKKRTNYHLRDWLVSRQRYWGAPIPMIDCPKCSWVAVAEKDLPVLLPNISDYKPEGTGKGPLANHEEFFEVECPKCGEKARRETDVMDTFVDSSWYFLRYPSVGAKSEKEKPFDSEITKKWLPVNLYFGGAEHSVLHLMYARFVTMVLYDLKFLDFDEPFPRFYAHGLMIKDGAKMSKSRGNVINPDEYIKKFGADALRIYLAFMGPMDASPDFRDSGIEGASRFLGRVWRLFHQSPITKHQLPDEAVVSKLHSVIKGVTEDIEQFKYNTALAKIMELVNFLTNNQSLITNNELGVLAKLLAPFAPHMMEEIWVEHLGMPFSIHKAPWPVYEAKYTVENEATIIIQIDGKLRSQLTITNLNASSHGQFTKEEVIEIAKKDTKITKYLDGCKIKNIIFVSGKLLNFVTE